jgi:hypothetical protein
MDDRNDGVGASAIRRHRKGLLAINGLLLGGVAVLGLWQAAGAQPSGPARPRGEYTAVSGKSVTGGGSDMVYILDGSNREIIALKWDASKKSFVGIGYRGLELDNQVAPNR